MSRLEISQKLTENNCKVFLFIIFVLIHVVTVEIMYENQVHELI